MDVFRPAFEQAAVHSAWAPLLAFCAGLASSAGPCMAERFVAVASLTAGLRGMQRALTATGFVAGISTTYVLLGTVTGAIGYVVAYSTWTYWLLALASVAAGVLALGRHVRPKCRRRRSRCAMPRSAVFLAGVMCSGVTSPCCGLVTTVLAGMTMAGGSGPFAALLLAAFAGGHSAPLIALSAGCERVERILLARDLQPALSTVSGGLLLALGGYYAVLA